MAQNERAGQGDDRSPFDKLRMVIYPSSGRRLSSRPKRRDLTGLVIYQFQILREVFPFSIAFEDQRVLLLSSPVLDLLPLVQNILSQGRAFQLDQPIDSLIGGKAAQCP